jgi:DNA (cytosine-5)-methyltransferase 1
MSRPQRAVYWMDDSLKLNASGILSRCDEILHAIYDSSTKRSRDREGLPNSQTLIDRVLRRMELWPPNGTNGSRTSFDASSLKELSVEFAQNLVRHARLCCTARNPKCESCPLVSFCRTGIRTLRLVTTHGPVAIDVFAGAGGLSAGFIREGFPVVLAIEKDRNAAQSYRVNNPGVPVIEADARKIQPRDLLLTLGCKRGDITAVIGGPPCQGFSAAGPRRPMARRNFLYRYLADIAKAVGARLLIMENVPGLKRVNGVGFTKRILQHFRKRGYIGETIEVDASQFGVPQRRKRVLFVCACREIPISSISLRPLKSKKNPSVSKALRGLPRPGVGSRGNVIRARHKLIYNHRAMAHGYKVIRKIRKIRAGEGPISYRRLRFDLARTLIAGHRAMSVHPRQHRTITVREAARLQTMPDWFRFLGPHSEQPLQVANVVPYQLARALARASIRALKENAPL